MPLSDGTPRTKITEDQMILSVDWGEIHGDINDQVDLRNLLNSKANATHTHTVNDITDVNLLDLLNSKANVEHKHTLSDIEEIDMNVSPQNGDVLTYLNNKWIPQQVQNGGEGGTTTLSGLTDVGVSNLIVNDILSWDSEKWVNHHGICEDSTVIIKAAFTNDPNDDIAIKWPGENKLMVNISGENTEIHYDDLYIIDEYLYDDAPAEQVQSIIDKLQIPININYYNMIYDATANGYVLPTTPTDVSVPWDITNILLAGDIVYGYSNNPILGLHMDPLGKKLYVIEDNTTSIVQYNLSTSFNISDAILYKADNYTYINDYSSIKDISFDLSGQFMSILFDYNELNVISNPFSKPWDIQSIHYGDFGEGRYNTNIKLYELYFPEIYDEYGDTAIKMNIYNSPPPTDYYYQLMGMNGIYIYHVDSDFNARTVTFYDRTINFADFGITNPSAMQVNTNSLFIYCKDTHTVYHFNVFSPQYLDTPTLIETIDIGISADAIYFRPDGYGFIVSWIDANNIQHLRSYTFGEPYITSGYIEVEIPAAYFGIMGNYSINLTGNYVESEYMKHYLSFLINGEEYMGDYEYYIDNVFTGLCPILKYLNENITVNDMLKIRFNAISYKSSMTPPAFKSISVVINEPKIIQETHFIQ